MTAYEVRISDWSSDVCSSDLVESDARGQRTAYGDEVGSRVDALATNELTLPIEQEGEGITFERTAQHDLVVAARRARHLQIGRASCRERVGQHVEISAVVVRFKKNKPVE